MNAAMKVTILTVAVFAATAVADSPQPVGTSGTSVSYTTPGGLQTFAGDRDFTSSTPGDATPLGMAPNIKSFNSVNTFGRRTFVANTGPAFAHALGDDESLIAHAFFKQSIDGDYFPEINADSSVTLQFDNITFDRAVSVADDTVMLHSFWNDGQIIQLGSPYFNAHNHEIASDSFRDFDAFSSVGVFSGFPVDNFVLGSDDLDIQILGEGTNSLSMTVTFPYSMLQHSEENGQPVDESLPAPHGFLEPFHFHLEYVVTPEPATLVLIAPAALYALKRRRRRTPARA